MIYDSMSMNIGNKKVALVHDFLNQYGGAERVLSVLHEIFPEAPIYTLLYDPAKMRGKFKDAEIRPSFLQKFPKFLKKRHKWLLPLMPTAPETFNLRDFDLVVSSSSAFAKGIIVKPKTIHVSYCHSPMRYSWDWNEKYLDEQGLGPKRRILARMLLNYIRMWDRVAADRVDFFIANSHHTKERIKKYYGQESVVVHPPVEIGHSETKFPLGSLVSKHGEYFLIVSRLSPYKKIEIAVEAMNKLGLPLVVIGEGSPKYVKYLKSIAGHKTKFLGFLPDEKIKKHFAECRAFIFPGEDDFGIAPVEAMSFGKPVIALRRGGATETVVEGETGEFFNEPTIEVLADAVRRFQENEKNYDPEKIRAQAEKFSKEKFRENFEREIRRILEN
ncbi:MAG: glycosyltransferase [Candidatus Moranbacteria bacterium]|nr:glycosyltransferase [Candidatus Moranbacteria bacterium]